MFGRAASLAAIALIAAVLGFDGFVGALASCRGGVSPIEDSDLIAVAVASAWLKP